MTTPVSTIRCVDPSHCTTCSDALELLRLDSISEDGSTGVGVSTSGERVEVFLTLIPAPRVGAWLHVHAGVALLISDVPAGDEETA